MEDLFAYQPHLYILDEHGNAVLVNTGNNLKDLLTWGEWFETNDRQVAHTYIEDPPRLRVSTIFIGINSRYFGAGPPILWETMIFAGEETPSSECPDHRERYSSRTDALKGHTRAVNVARRFLQELDAKNAAKENG